MNPAFVKEFAIPRVARRWSFKGSAEGLISRPLGWMKDQEEPKMAPVENISSLMTVGDENFKWSPEKNAVADSSSIQYVSSWTMPFMKMRLLLCLLGAVPMTWKKPYVPSLHPLQSTMLYSLAVYSSLSVSMIIACSDYIWTLSNEVISASQQVLYLEMIILLAAHLLTPILWIDSSDDAEGFQVWASLTEDYYRLTGKKLASRRPGLEWICIFFALLLPVCIFLAIYLGPVDVEIPNSHTPTYVHAGTVHFALSFIWIGTAMTLGDVADDITTAFRESIEKNGATSEVLVEHRRLWVMLRSVSDLMGEMLSPLFVVTHDLVLITLFLYEGLVFINKNETTTGVVHFLCSGMLVTELFLMCRASHYTAIHMKLPIEEVLDTLPVATITTTAEREVIMFYLVESAKPAVTTLNGFVTVNKSLFSSMLAAVSTYLIVLMQFHQSSDGFSSKNTTVSFI